MVQLQIEFLQLCISGVIAMFQVEVPIFIYIYTNIYIYIYIYIEELPDISHVDQSNYGSGCCYRLSLARATAIGCSS